MKNEWIEEAFTWKNPEDLFKVCVKQQKEIERLTKRLEESQLAYLQVDKDKQRLHSIIKEVREKIMKDLDFGNPYVEYDFGTELLRQELLEILQGSDKK